MTIIYKDGKKYRLRHPYGKLELVDETIKTEEPSIHERQAADSRHLTETLWKNAAKYWPEDGDSYRQMALPDGTLFSSSSAPNLPTLDPDFQLREDKANGAWKHRQTGGGASQVRQATYEPNAREFDDDGPLEPGYTGDRAP